MAGQPGAPTPKMQLVDGEAQFNTTELQSFVANAKLVERKTEYQVVAIMGPQSSGKSTLLNHVFGTSFVMMDAMTGRSQTTKGIWMSLAPKITEHLTLVMDLEGNDGRERGEDDTNFERQSALFALAVADILLVNIWCHDIGREQGAGKPLLKTIFQVNLKLFAPDPSRKRTVLLFVIRDKTKTPMTKLIEVMESDLAKMWDSISKPPQYADSKLSDFFDVQYSALSHFEEKYEDFIADTVTLRRRFLPDGDDSLVRPNDHLPGAAFSLSVQKIWEVIRTQKDLNLPAHKIMVANIRCAEIAADQLRAFTEDQAWQALVGQAMAEGAGVQRGVNSRVASLLESCVAGYEADAMYFDAKVRDDKLKELKAKLRDTVAPVMAAQTAALHAAQLSAAQKDLSIALMGHHSGGSATAATATGGAAAAAAGGGAAPGNRGGERSKGEANGPVQFAAAAAGVRASALAAWRKAYGEDLKIEGTEWDGKEAGAVFERALDSHIAGVRAERIAQAVGRAEKGVAASTSGPIIALLDACPGGLWAKLHAVTRDAAAQATKSLLQALSGFELSESEHASLATQLSASAERRLENHVREAALTRISRMKDRFTEVFTLDAHKTPRMWRPHDNIPLLAREARLAAAQLLAQLAVIRSPQQAEAAAVASAGGGAGDGVEAAVLQLARADLEDGAAASEQADGVVDILSAAVWPGVDEGAVLLQPHEVRTAWREFMSSSNVAVQQALSAQQANRMAGSRPPPFWAILAILFLGWNEFMAVLWNPIYLILGLLVFLFGRTLYSELDVDGEMARGALPGALSLAAKLGPTTRAVAARTVESLQQFVVKLPEEVQHVKQYISEQELSASVRGAAEAVGLHTPQHASAGGLSRRRAAPTGATPQPSTPSEASASSQADKHKAA